MIAIIDYDAGNIKSVEKACVHLGHEAVITKEPEEILSADKVILPGVGAFGHAMEKLKTYHLIPVIRRVADSGTPFLGICLGLQLLFETSEESPGVEGLGLLKGRIRRIPMAEGLNVPHMGWNSITFPNRSPLFGDVPENSFVYFVHSYYLEAEDRGIVAASCQYGVKIDAAVCAGNVWACQFHPEKSSDVGLRILNNFLKG